MSTEDQDLLEEVRSEAATLELARFTHKDARAIGEAARDEIDRRGLPAVVRVVRGEQIAFQASFAGTTAEHDDWLRRKVNSVLQHDVPSLELVLRHRVSGRAPDWLDPQRFAVAGGAVPVRVAGCVVGVVAVSGLVDSVRSDHDLAMRAVRAHRDAEGSGATR